jgi:hypothetical protein
MRSSGVFPSENDPLLDLKTPRELENRRKTGAVHGELTSMDTVFEVLAA